jgi:hypothetical protein
MLAKFPFLRVRYSVAFIAKLVLEQQLELEFRFVHNIVSIVYNVLYAICYMLYASINSN